jgi:hypothetical protein
MSRREVQLTTQTLLVRHSSKPVQAPVHLNRAPMTVRNIVRFLLSTPSSLLVLSVVKSPLTHAAAAPFSSAKCSRTRLAGRARFCRSTRPCRRLPSDAVRMTRRAQRHVRVADVASGHEQFSMFRDYRHVRDRVRLDRGVMQIVLNSWPGRARCSSGRG